MSYLFFLSQRLHLQFSMTKKLLCQFKEKVSYIDSSLHPLVREENIIIARNGRKKVPNKIKNLFILSSLVRPKILYVF